MNFDFAGITGGSSGIALGSLRFSGLSGQPLLNGQTVNTLFADMNSVLGGGSSSTYGALELTIVAAEVNAAFVGGQPSAWAQEHLSACTSTPSNQCPTAAAASAATSVGMAVKIKLQGADADNDALTYSISQNPAHGTAVIVGNDSALYTPAAGYSGSDQFNYKANDGTCEAEATVDITIVVCPVQHGYWKNNAAAWPASATPMLLGTVSYTKAQLIAILKTPIGTGKKADASLILAHALIGVKVSIANGSPTTQALLDSVAAADALIGGNVIPMKIHPSTALGMRFVALATYFSNYATGATTAGCGGSSSGLGLRMALEQPSGDGFVLDQNFPNPFDETTTIGYRLTNESYVRLTVYNFIGERIATLSDGMQKAGNHSAVFNAEDFPNGIYFCRMEAGEFTGTIRLLLAK